MALSSCSTTGLSALPPELAAWTAGTMSRAAAISSRAVNMRRITTLPGRPRETALDGDKAWTGPWPGREGVEVTGFMNGSLKGCVDRKSVVEGKRIELGARRSIRDE